ncbi:MAG: RHS repeat protein [Flavobacteriaceae bacterium]|nr:RHS repeat protein [Flavobacteriaceae bacterium]
MNEPIRSLKNKTDEYYQQKITIEKKHTMTRKLLQHISERGILYSLLLFFSIVHLMGQEIPNLIPPSPEAAAITSYANNNVSYYTGSAQIGVPIFEVQGNGLSVPISLNYTGSGGIRVEQVASWVGLGWTLNAGGVISRTIRGRKDDDNSNGYRFLSAIPEANSTANYDLYEDFALGEKDSEPDEFQYSFGGYSGSFYLQKDGGIFFKPISEIKVVPTYLSSGEIDKFDVIVPSGETYTFSVKESNRSKTIGSTYTDNTYKTNAWYLSRITNNKGTDFIDFVYSEHYTQNVTLSPLSAKPGSASFDGSDILNVQVEQYVQLLDSIKSKQHLVVFEKSTSNRLDLSGAKYLKKIKVFDANGNAIKNFRLDHSYFGPSGTVAENATPSNSAYAGSATGDFELRLKLNSVTECNASDNDCLPPFEFQYYSSQYLPSRYSYAQDHWGYYNGQSGNTTLEPEYRMKWNVTGNPTVQHQEFGSANREPSGAYAKAGMLTKVIYPTGGSTLYNYELHDVENSKLPNETTSKSYSLSTSNSSSLYDTTITVNVSANPYEIIAVNGTAFPVETATVGSNCDMAINFYDNSDQLITGVSFDISDTQPNYSDEAYLDAGTYKVKAWLSGCNTTNVTYGAAIGYEDEVATYKKKVGGVRIKSIVNDDGEGEGTTDEYFYDESGDGTGQASTGRISSVPKYGLLNTFVDGVYQNPPVLISAGVFRTVGTSQPLTYTNGSAVGYGKVTVRRTGSKNIGKSEYYYSTPAHFPDYQFGSFSVLNIVRYPGTEESETYPIAHYDDRDYLRGRLVKKMDYEYSSSLSNYRLIQETVYDYTVLHSFPRADENGPGQLIDPYDDHSVNQNEAVIQGVRFHQDISAGVKWKIYNIYTSRVELSKTITKIYDKGSSTVYLETVNENIYRSSDLANGNYIPRISKGYGSDGRIIETFNYFPFDNDSLPVSTAQETVLEGMVSANQIATPVLTKQYKSGNLLGTSQTLITNPYTGQYFPSEVLTSKGSNSLESRLEYSRYQSGNLVEVKQTSGQPITYIWGYNGQYPVAKIQNATYAEVEALSAFGTNFNLGNGGLTAAQDTALRGLSNALVTSMTYKLGVGVEIQTDPNGRKTTYIYDDFGRLSQVKDHDGNIIQSYSYNLKGSTTSN